MEAKRYFGTAFVIDEVAYICCGRNNSTDLVDFWKFDGSNWTQLRDIADTDSDNDYDDDYAITRSEAVSFVIGGRGFVATGIRNSTSLSSDYWLYDPDKDLWYGDSDDDFTPLQMYIIILPVLLRAECRWFLYRRTWFCADGNKWYQLL